MMTDSLLTSPPPPSPPSDPSSNERRLIDYLADNDAACPLCDYNLRGLSRAACPECGRALQLRVGLVEPRMWPWVAVAAVACVFAGLGLMLLMMVSLLGMPPAYGPQPLSLLRNAFIIGLIGSIPVAGLVLWKRRRFMRLKWATQRAAGIGVIVAGVLVVAIFFALLVVTLR